MRTPVGHLAARIGSPLHPAKLERRVVGPQRRLPTPLVPVVPFGERLFRQPLIDSWARIVAGLHDLQFADAAAAYQVTGESVHFHSPLLAAHLEHGPVLSRRLNQHATLVNCES